MAALSVLSGTITAMARWRGGEAAAGVDGDGVLVSHTGLSLPRHCAFKFALDPNQSQDNMLFQYAGAARFGWNHHIGRVKANLAQRDAEKSYGLAGKQLTPSLSWSKQSFINEMNAWKNGLASDSPLDTGTGERGVTWRGEVSTDVFECASVDAATALKNWRESRDGSRAGAAVGFPDFRAKRRQTPRFRLRSRSKPGQTAPVRVTGPKTLRLGKLGEVRIHGCTSRVRKMITKGRFHIHAASFSYEKGRWWVSLHGVAAEFHHVRRSATPGGGVRRWQSPAGLDRGVKSLAVVADAGAPGEQMPDEMDVLHVTEGVRALQHAEQALRRANKALSRSKKGSNGRRKARERLVKLHARVAFLRKEVTHRLTHWCASHLTTLTIETLNVKGMMQLRNLAKAVSDAAMAEVGKQLRYKCAWYGVTLHEADQWFPSSKTCSHCGAVKADLSLAERVYRCDGTGLPDGQSGCGLTLDRDVNAAVNLARWPLLHSPEAKAALAAGTSAAGSSTRPPPLPEAA